MSARTSPERPLVEQQQEEGQRHHSDGTLDPKVFHRGHDYLGRTMSGAEPVRTSIPGSPQTQLPGVVPPTWVYEVGFRAALHTEQFTAMHAGSGASIGRNVKEMAETQAAKVDRYIAEDRVTKQLELPDGGSVWRINADTGTYRLTIDDVGVEWQCTCPAALRGRQDCAHAWAVLKLMGLEPEEVEPVQVVDTDAGVLELLEDTEDENTPVAAPVLVSDPTISAAPFDKLDTRTRREVDVTDAPVTWRVIETIQHSEAVPKSLRGKPEAILAAMLLGRDWHLGPFEALRQIDVIEGTFGPRR